MPMSRARQLVPDLMIVSPHFDKYHERSEQVMNLLKGISPDIEQLSVDEAFIDISHYPEPSIEWARRIQKRINQELLLPCSLGGAQNKLVAKIANNIGKSRHQGSTYPNAIHIIQSGKEKEFLFPLRIRELYGVGKQTEKQLQALGITHIGQLAQYDVEQLVYLLGKNGRSLHQYANGIDERPVESGSDKAKSISAETTFNQDIQELGKIKSALKQLSDRVARRAREKEQKGSTIGIKMRYPDFSTLTRQTTLRMATDRPDDLYNTALQLFIQNWDSQTAIRLIGVSLSGFKEEEDHQLSLWGQSQKNKQEEILLKSIDELNKKFGSQTIKKGSYFGKEEKEE
ncbi:DNA polymerase IV [Anaerolineales bacterium]